MSWIWKLIDFFRSLLKALERAKSEKRAREVREEVEDENSKLSDDDRRRELDKWVR